MSYVKKSAIALGLLAGMGAWKIERKSMPIPFMIWHFQFIDVHLIKIAGYMPCLMRHGI